jgi:hypothetical protein
VRALLRRLRCVLGGGHLRVTKNGGGQVYRACYVCGAKLGAGWSQRGLSTPVPRYPLNIWKTRTTKRMEDRRRRA